MTIVSFCLLLFGCGNDSQSSNNPDGQNEIQSTASDSPQHPSSSDIGSQCAKVAVVESKDGSKVVKGYFGEVQFYELTFDKEGGGIEEQGMPFVFVPHDTIFHAGKRKQLVYAYVDFPEFEESMFWYTRNDAGEMTEPIPLQHKGCLFTTMLTFPRVETIHWGLRFVYRPSDKVYWQQIDADFEQEVQE